jgi:phosphohistidine phosphatase SixA
MSETNKELLPKTIIFLRHADEPIHGDSLSPAGMTRASNLAHNWETKLNLPHPDYIYASGSGSLRSRQTAKYIADKFHLKVNDKIKKDNYNTLVNNLYKNNFQNEVVVIVWEHTILETIIKTLTNKKIKISGYNQLFIWTPFGDVFTELEQE